VAKGVAETRSSWGTSAMPCYSRLVVVVVPLVPGMRSLVQPHRCWVEPHHSTRGEQQTPSLLDNPHPLLSLPNPPLPPCCCVRTTAASMIARPTLSGDRCTEGSRETPEHHYLPPPTTTSATTPRLIVLLKKAVLNRNDCARSD
jgi:hypothetical protein